MDEHEDQPLSNAPEDDMEENAQEDVDIGQPGPSRIANKKSRRVAQPEPEVDADEGEGGDEDEDEDGAGDEDEGEGEEEEEDKDKEEEEELLAQWREYKVCKYQDGNTLLISPL